VAPPSGAPGCMFDTARSSFRGLEHLSDFLLHPAGLASHWRSSALREQCSAALLRSSALPDQCTALPSCWFSELDQSAVHMHKKWRGGGSMYGVAASVCDATASVYGGTLSP
jgi:hypothetical protein